MFDLTQIISKKRFLASIFSFSSQKKLKLSAMSRTEFEKGAKCIIKIEKAKTANLWNRQTKTDIELIPFERIISTFRSFCLFLASILRPF